MGLEQITHGHLILCLYWLLNIQQHLLYMALFVAMEKSNYFAFGDISMVVKVLLFYSTIEIDYNFYYAVQYLLSYQHICYFVG